MRGGEVKTLIGKSHNEVQANEEVSAVDCSVLVCTMYCRCG